MPFFYKIVFLQFFLLLCICSGRAQIELLPLNELPELRQNDPHLKGGATDRDYRYRNYRLYAVSPEKELTICFDTMALTGRFDTLIDNRCRELQNGTVEVTGNCIVYNAFQVDDFGFDTLCFTIRGTEGSTRERNIIIKTVKPLPLPVMDDFSYEGPYPDPAVWMDINVFVNNRLANDPPSIGVATFDGLDPYGGARGGGRGGSDTLTSNFIDLSSYGPTSNVYLSYFLQPKGKGLQPLMRDSFVVQFKNEQGNWVSVRQFEGLQGGSQNNESPPFAFQAERIGLPYFHDNFQFRFINYASRTGLENLWHLDYVRVTGTGVPDGSNEDVAFTKEPSYLFNKHTAVPIKQFRANPAAYISGTIDIGVFNHFPNRVTVAPSDMRIVEKVSGSQIAYFPTLLEVPPIAPVNQRDLDPGLFNFTNHFNNTSTIANITAIMNDVEEMELETVYTLSQSTEAGNNFQPTLRNNETRIISRVSDYFAYDDGTAERVISVHASSGPNAPIAVRFTLEAGDTLRGIAIHFPRYDTRPFDPFRIMIWKDNLDSEPVLEGILENPLYGDEYYREFNAFTVYTLKEMAGQPGTQLYLGAGDFYIGWQKTGNNGRIPVGYDTNTDARAETFVRQGSLWQSLEEIPGIFPGSVMIRPVFGRERIFGTSVSPEKKVSDLFRVFPNPSAGIIHLEPAEGLETGQAGIEIYDMGGRRVYAGAWQPSLNLSGWPKGVYLLHLIQASQPTRQINKIILN